MSAKFGPGGNSALRVVCSAQCQPPDTSHTNTLRHRLFVACVSVICRAVAPRCGCYKAPLPYVPIWYALRSWSDTITSYIRIHQLPQPSCRASGDYDKYAS